MSVDIPIAATQQEIGIVFGAVGCNNGQTPLAGSILPSVSACFNHADMLEPTAHRARNPQQGADVTIAKEAAKLAVKGLDLRALAQISGAQPGSTSQGSGVYTQAPSTRGPGNSL